MEYVHHRATMKKATADMARSPSMGPSRPQEGGPRFPPLPSLDGRRPLSDAGRLGNPGVQGIPGPSPFLVFRHSPSAPPLWGPRYLPRQFLEGHVDTEGGPGLGDVRGQGPGDVPDRRGEIGDAEDGEPGPQTTDAGFRKLGDRRGDPSFPLVDVDETAAMLRDDAGEPFQVQGRPGHGPLLEAFEARVRGNPKPLAPLGDGPLA